MKTNLSEFDSWYGALSGSGFKSLSNSSAHKQGLLMRELITDRQKSSNELSGPEDMEGYVLKCWADFTRTAQWPRTSGGAANQSWYFMLAASLVFAICLPMLISSGMLFTPAQQDDVVFRGDEASVVIRPIASDSVQALAARLERVFIENAIPYRKTDTGSNTIILQAKFSDSQKANDLLEPFNLSVSIHGRLSVIIKNVE
jgi:hypothetical protein